MMVIKRDGKTIEDFDDNKIRTAIMKAVEGSHSKEELKERFDESKLNDLINWRKSRQGGLPNLPGMTYMLQQTKIFRSHRTQM